MTSQLLDSIKEFSASGKYSESLKKIEEAEAQGMLSAELLVWKSRLLQLIDDGASLDEVEKTLQRATELDNTCIPAVLELGWFRFNVQNDTKRALESFQKALKLQESANTEAITGFLKCVQELEPNCDLEEAKSRALRALVDEAKLSEALRE